MGNLKLAKFMVITCGWLLLATPLFADQEGGGGSTIRVGETDYVLADLKFQALPHDRYFLNKELVQQIRDIEIALRTKVDVRLDKPGRSQYLESDFFKAYVFDERIEYRFVDKLPENCQFISHDNLPIDADVEDIGCTEGDMTFLRPAKFILLNTLQKALLLVHERLHAFAPDEGFTVKAEFIHGLYVLMNTYMPAYKEWEKNKELNQFTFTDEERIAINRLGQRASQLSDQKVRQYYFTKDGGCIENGEIESDTVKLHLGSVIDGATTITGENIDISNSTISGTKISANNVTIDNSNIRSWLIEGDNLKLTNLVIVGGSRPGYEEVLYDYAINCTNLIFADSSIVMNYGITMAITGNHVDLHSLEYQNLKGKDPGLGQVHPNIFIKRFN